MSFALSPLRVVTGLVFASVISLFAAAGCSQQAEGERCDKAKNGDADCDGGLICVPAADLLEKSADRCCHPSTTDQGDDRCTRGNETSNNPPVITPAGGAGGAAGSDSGGAPDQGGTAGMSGGGTAGMSGGGTGDGASGASGAPAEGGASGAANESGGAGAGGAP